MSKHNAALLSDAIARAKQGGTTIPSVPQRTPIYDDTGALTKPWLYFFERVQKKPQKATLDLMDTTVGDDIAPHVPVHVAGAGLLVLAVLRKAITADLTVLIHKGADTISITIPKTTAVDAVLSVDIGTVRFAVGEAIRWDVKASDGSKDADGVATVLVSWQ